jgi:hypothetical protein
MGEPSGKEIKGKISRAVFFSALNSQFPLFFSAISHYFAFPVIRGVL